MHYSLFMDEIDRNLLRLLQEDGALSASELGESVGLAGTSCWRRVQRLQQLGVITKRVALVDPAAVNLGVAALVEIRTNDHSEAWLDRFTTGIGEFSEIVAAWHGLARSGIDQELSGGLTKNGAKAVESLAGL